MLIIRSRNPNSAERELIKVLEPLDGVAFVGYIVTQGDKEREIDLLVFTPVRATVVEVKAPQLGTKSVGELKPYLNSVWTIDDEEAQFYGGSHPNNQARLNAQIFAQFLKTHDIERTPFIQSAVFVAGDELEMPNGPKMVGQTVAALNREAIQGLELMKKKPVTLKMVTDIVEVLDLGPLRPSDSEIADEWARAEEHHKAIPKKPVTKEIAAAAKKVVAPYPPEKDKSPFQRWISKVSDYAAIFVAIFLFVFFLNDTGALELAQDLPKDLWSQISGEPASPLDPDDPVSKILEEQGIIPRSSE